MSAPVYHSGTIFLAPEAMEDVLIEAHPGMSMRDYFAAAALTGLLAQSQGSATVSDPAIGAKYAYTLADAMLAARAAADGGA